MKASILFFTILVGFKTFADTSRFAVFLNTAPSKVIYVEITDDLETADAIITYKIDFRKLIASALEPRLDSNQISDYILSHYAPKEIGESGILQFQATLEEDLFNKVRSLLILNVSPMILKMGVDVSTLGPNSKLIMAHEELEIFRAQIEKPFWM